MAAHYADRVLALRDGRLGEHVADHAYTQSDVPTPGQGSERLDGMQAGGPALDRG